MHQVVSNTQSCEESVPKETVQGMTRSEGSSDSLSRRNKGRSLPRKRSGLLTGLKPLSMVLNHLDDEGEKEDICSLSSSNTLSCDESDSSIDQTWTRNDDRRQRSAQDLQRGHRSEKLVRSCCSLSGGKDISTVHRSNHRATWSVDLDSPESIGRRRMKNNRLLNADVASGCESIGSESPTSRSPKSGANGKGRSILLLKSFSKRVLCSSENVCEDEEKHKDEPLMGIEELAQNIHQLIEENEKAECNCTGAIKLQLELAMARQVTGNTRGAIIAMKKMKRIQGEQKKYMTAIAYLRDEEINIRMLQERKDHNSIDWISRLQVASKEVEWIFSVYENVMSWTNEALLDELMGSNQQPVNG